MTHPCDGQTKCKHKGSFSKNVLKTMKAGIIRRHRDAAIIALWYFSQLLLHCCWMTLELTKMILMKCLHTTSLLQAMTTVSSGSLSWEAYVRIAIYYFRCFVGTDGKNFCDLSNAN